MIDFTFTVSFLSKRYFCEFINLKLHVIMLLLKQYAFTVEWAFMSERASVNCILLY